MDWFWISCLFFLSSSARIAARLIDWFWKADEKKNRKKTVNVIILFLLLLFFLL